MSAISNINIQILYEFDLMFINFIDKSVEFTDLIYTHCWCAAMVVSYKPIFLEYFSYRSFFFTKNEIIESFIQKSFNSACWYAPSSLFGWTKPRRKHTELPKMLMVVVKRYEKLKYQKYWDPDFGHSEFFHPDGTRSPCYCVGVCTFFSSYNKWK